jgi:restriction system protein
VEEIISIFLHFSKQYVKKFSLEDIISSIRNAQYKVEKPKDCEQPIAPEPINAELRLDQPIKPQEPKFVEFCPNYHKDLNNTGLFRLLISIKKIIPLLSVKIIPTPVLNKVKYQEELRNQVKLWRNEHEKWQENHKEWEHLYSKWKLKEKAWASQYNAYERQYNEYLVQKKIHETYCAGMKRWESNKLTYEKNRNNDIEKCLELKSNYFAGNKNGVLDFCSLVINQSPLLKPITKNFTLHYDEITKILLIDFQLPDIEKISITKKDKYDDAVEVTKAERKKYQEFILFALPICIMWELAKLEKQNIINSIAFNGWVHFIDKSTGQPKDACILSVHATKKQLENIVIENISPKECFKSLKGLSANKIIEYVPIAPMITFDKNDKRLVPGRDVLCDLGKDENLAAMDWEDFEHLIRELFEKEFANGGAEVRVTQTSRDRGVDAIIYDPDPLRGGKFVIQAKRYTATVDVSAIRDLYGTILNEGANRGIIVTTSSYGGDSYEFAKDKPITLLDGSNLLHLLQKHGYHFRIDLKEARLFASENSVSKKSK